MRLFNFLTKKKLLLLNILLTIYIATNMIGGERGLVSYYEKEKKQKIKNVISIDTRKSAIMEKSLNMVPISLMMFPDSIMILIH